MSGRVSRLSGSYGNDTSMGKVSHVTRHLSNVLGANPVSMTVSEAMAAAYSSINLFKTPARRDKKKKVEKPWAKHQKPTTAGSGNKLRRGITHIRNMEDKNVEFKPTGNKIALRLEKTMGTPTCKPFDLKYMGTLSDKIKVLDQSQFQQRMLARQKVEVQRRRQLVIDGLAVPEPGEESLLRHPVLRVKRLLGKVNKTGVGGKTITVGNIPVPPPHKLKKIKPVEPFNEYEKTGILFGHHKEHYLRVKAPGSSDETPNTGPPKPSTEVHSESSLLFHPSFTSSNKKVRTDASNLNLQGSELETRESWRDSTEGLNDTQAPAAEVEDAVELGGLTGSNTDALGENLASTAQKNVEPGGGESLSGATRTSKGITSESDATSSTSSAQDVRDVAKRLQSHLPMLELEKLYLQVRSQLVNEVYKENQEFADSLFYVGTEVIKAYRREQAKTDEFCKNALRKAFN